MTFLVYDKGIWWDKSSPKEERSKITEIYCYRYGYVGGEYRRSNPRDHTGDIRSRGTQEKKSEDGQDRQVYRR